VVGTAWYPIGSADIGARERARRSRDCR